MRSLNIPVTLPDGSPAVCIGPDGGGLVRVRVRSRAVTSSLRASELRPRYGEASLRIGATAITDGGVPGVVESVYGGGVFASLRIGRVRRHIRVDGLLPEAEEPSGDPAPAHIGDRR